MPRASAHAGAVETGYLIYARKNGRTESSFQIPKPRLRAYLLATATSLILCGGLGGTGLGYRVAQSSYEPIAEAYKAAATLAHSELKIAETRLAISDTKKNELQDQLRQSEAAAEQRIEETQKRAETEIRSLNDRSTRQVEALKNEAQAAKAGLMNQIAVLKNEYDQRLQVASQKAATAIALIQAEADTKSAEQVELIRKEAVAKIEAAELRLEQYEARLKSEQAYSGQLMRYARQQKALADRTSSQVLAVASSARQVTQESLRILSGQGKPGISTDVSSESLATADLANTWADLGRVLQTSRTVPLAPPMRNASFSSTSASSGTANGALAFVAEAGTAISASGSGTVTFAGRSGNDGLVVEIDHGRNITTRYRRLASVDVRQGQRINAGNTVGYSGPPDRNGRGLVAFEVLVDGKPTDPREALERGAEFRQALEAHDTRLQTAVSRLPPAKNK